jgi:signal transduction histidine kinase
MLIVVKPLQARPLLRWWRRLGLRSRVTLMAALGLLVALMAGDLLLLNALRVSLTRSVDDSARSGAAQVATLLNANRLPNPVPVAAGVTIQVLDSAGRISYVSPEADRLVPVVPFTQAQALASGGAAIAVRGAPFDMPALLRVAVVRTDNGSLILAAVPFSAANGSLTVVARALLLGTPVLFIVFTGAIWLVTGSTLRPIGALRRGAARVTARGLTDSAGELPVPEARDEVRLLAVTLNDMLSRLAAAQQRQRTLVSDTAHELRSPIASIRTQLEVALDFPGAQDWETTARDVHADVLRLARLAEDLLLLARLDEQAGLSATGPPAAVLSSAVLSSGVPSSAGAPGTRGGTAVDLAKLSRTVAGRYADARVPVTVLSAAEQDDDKIVVDADWERLDRLLVNLVDNAVRYARTRVTVGVGRGGGLAELSVTDDGPGIPAGQRERAFDRFARLDDARSRDGDEAGGAGLGLAIVRATAQAYGGTAHLENPVDSQASASGLRAIVRLPLG